MKFIFGLMTVVCLMASPAFAGQASVQIMRNGVIATGTSSNFAPSSIYKSFYAKGAVSAATGASTIVIEGCNVASAVNGDWVTLGTITLTLGTTSVGDGFASNAAWKYVRARVSAISGTNATVYVYLATQ